MTSEPALHSSPAATRATGFPLENRSWPREAWLTARAYTTLAKPGIIWLLLVTTVPAMVMAEHGWPGLDLIALVLLGGVLTSGGANALNQWFDRDIDALMYRTRNRPIPQGRVTARQALLFGSTLVAVGGVQLALTVNLLSAGLALGAVAFYVLVYTIWLKRRTPQNIVIGGAAGSVPPLVGWGCGTERPGSYAAAPLPDHLPLDATSLLGLGTTLQGRLRARASADVASNQRRGHD